MEVSEFREQVIERSYNKPVVAYFWADWCEPCAILTPILMEIALENIRNWVMVKIDTEESKELSESLNIKGIPVIKAFYKGEEIAQFNGMMYKKEMAAWFDENVINNPKLKAV